MPEQPEIRVEATRYEVNAMPAGATGAGLFVLRVERLPDGWWTVRHGSLYLGLDGQFRAILGAKFILEGALERARYAAPRVRVQEMTAGEFRAWAAEQEVDHA